ncbi:MAG: hypothetical protein ACIAXF_02520 [Phycisphaerales bacterium JB063]
MHDEPLKINDNDRSTEGGPPGWMAFSIIVAAAVLIAVVAIVVGILL